MLQREFLGNLERSARATKENVTHNGPGDINSYVVVHRGEDPIAVVTLRRSDRDALLAAADLCLVSFEADNLGLVFETYETINDPERPDLNGKNPMTGDWWQPGEINDAVTQHDAIAKGWISECISITAANRAGDVGMRNLMFSYGSGTFGGRQLSWHKHPQDWTLGITDGEIPQRLRAMMLRPSLSQQFPGQLPGTLDERDVMAAAVLRAEGHAVLMYARSTDSERLRAFGGDWHQL